jgi:phage-related baseplate assembly protein
MSGTSIRELATLPMPGVIETLSFDAVFADMARDFQQRYPDFTALLESDPAIKLLEVASYRELLLRNRINEAARGQMLAFAVSTDLDHLGAFYGVQRLEGEGDSALRRRIRQRIMGFSNAGGADTYRYWALEHFKIENALKGMDCRAASPLAMTIPCAMTTHRHS